MGTQECREWLATEARMVPAKNIKVAWPAARIYFLARQGQFSAEALAQRLAMPLRDQYAGKIKPGGWLDKSLWRVRVEPWKDGWDEVAVSLRSPEELGRLLPVMAEALDQAGPWLGA
jgi:hypothetical protein